MYNYIAITYLGYEVISLLPFLSEKHKGILFLIIMFVVDSSIITIYTLHKEITFKWYYLISKY